MNKQSKKIIVTGGAGFIGSHIASRLCRDGHQVTVLDDLSTGQRENVPEDAQFIQMDLSHFDSYVKLDDVACDVVLHFAGQSSGEASFLDPIRDMKSHVNSTLALLQWCQKMEVSRFVYASSMAVYGNPHELPVSEQHPLIPKTIYAASKASAELYVRLFQSLGIDTTIFRLFSVYGPGQNLENKMQGMISIYLSYMLENEPILVKGSKERFRDFVFIDDLVEAWMQVMDHPNCFGKTYNLCSGNKTTVEEVIHYLKESIGNTDYPIQYKGNTQGDQFGVFGDNRLISSDLSWKAQTDVQTGISKMVEAHYKGATVV